MTKLEKKSLELLNQRVQETNPQNLKEKYLPSTEKYQTTESPSNQQPKIYNFIGSFAQAPKFLQGNRFILHGYRINYDTPKKILNTLFILHNELVNIWSHLLGALLVICLIVYISFCLKTFSNQSVRNEIENKIQSFVSPIYEEIKNIENSVNEHTFEALKPIKEDLAEYNKHLRKKFDDFNDNIKGRTINIIKQLDLIKNNLNKENVNYLCEHIQDYLQKYTKLLDHQADNLPNTTLKTYLSYLANELNGIKARVFEKIGSESNDWIDLYKTMQIIHPDINDLNQHISRIPIFIFLTSAILCMLFSALFHLFRSMNKKTYDKMHRLDYAGISLLIFGSTFPPLVYCFYCKPIYYIIYETLIGGACLTVFVISFFDALHSPEYRKLKGVLYGSLGIFAGLPIFHLIFIEIMKDPNSIDKFSSMPIVPNFILMGVCYLTGLAIYVYQCPERFKPGQYDILGSSHQLWHLIIVIAIIITYFGSLQAYHLRIENKCSL